jgi:hypothetical protein
MSNKDKIIAYLTEPRTIKAIAEHIESNYPITKNILTDMRDKNIIHAYKDNDNRLMHYYIPQPHPLQAIFGHTVNFTDAQIKGVISHNADDSRHNLQHNTTRETFGESITYTLGQYD